MAQSFSRRNFLELSAGAAVGSGLVTPVLGKATAFQQINPAIPNSRTVCCIDENMVTNPSSSGTFSAQNGAVATETVYANMDAMAMMLAGKSSASEAWGTIFQRGAKQWSELKVAIKVNCQVEKGTAHAAVIGGVCKGLVGLGVSASNIQIYDGSTNAQAASNIGGIYGPYIGAGKPIPAGVSAVKSSLSGQVTSFIADGSTDILISLANNKGHTFGSLGYVTLTMKNHYGTYSPFIYGSHNSMSNLISTSKRDDLVGGNPPRQQLCIVDSLWGSTPHDNWASYDRCPSCLVMGTLSSVVDYVTIKKVREPIMNMSAHPADPVNKMLSEFDVSASDVDAQYAEINGGMVNTVSRNADRTQFVSLHVPSTGGAVVFSVAAGEQYKLTITTLEGRIVRTFDGIAGPGQRMLWDGKDVKGRLCAHGTYALRCVSGREIQSATVQFR